jgi:hypothetical protein
MDIILPTKQPMWKNIWSNDGLPKVNTFCWTLAHGKILTGENLAKRGIKGPFHCTLCKKSEETSQHLFLECNFAK